MKIIFFTLLISLPVFSSAFSFNLPYGGNPYGGSIPHDTILFDGNNSGVLVFDPEWDDKCVIKVLHVFGEIKGTYTEDTIVQECLTEHMQITRTGKLRRGLRLVPGTQITTNDGGDPSNAGGIVNLDINGRYVIIMNNAIVDIGKDCNSMHVKWGRVDVSGEYDITTSRTKISHKQTKYSVETVKDGDKVSDVIKVYEGSVELKPNNETPEFKESAKKRREKLNEEVKKLNDDMKNGKITADEFKQRYQELQQKINSVTELYNSVTVEAGYMSSVTDGEKPTEPAPFDVNADKFPEISK